MSTFLGPLLSYLLIYKYVLLAGVIFASGIIPIPVDTFVLAAGAFASQGYFSLALSLMSATLANVAADFIVYLIARRYGPRALKFFRVETSARVKRLEGYIRDHGAVTIFLTRFVGGLDIAGTVLAGLADVSPRFFLTFDLLGNAAEIAMLLALGYFFGAYWQAIANAMGIIGWVLLAIGLGVFGISYRHYRHAIHRVDSHERKH